MLEKELRLALICYGGVSLAVYMHGITKEIWRLVRASRNFNAGEASAGGSEAAYRALLENIEARCDIKMRVLADIIAGASAGGLNGIFLAQAISSGQSLDPLTDLWLETADVDTLLDPDARPWSRFSKFWAMPIAWAVLRRKGGTVEKTVSEDSRDEVATKMSRFVRGRWFAPPFDGPGFTKLLFKAIDAMRRGEQGPVLLPPGQPLDLFVTVTDFHGHPEALRLNSPPLVIETEHRITVSFSTHKRHNESLADPAELVFAARATASFPGAFPPFTVDELDEVLKARGDAWPNRDAFLKRILPAQHKQGEAEKTVLIDGSVLANAPFGEAIDALKDRPARREIDRRFVYIDPKPELRTVSLPVEGDNENESGEARIPGFFSTIFGAMSNIPREQPIRDNVESLERRSARIKNMQQITANLRAEVDKTVELLFDRTLFMDKPTAKRLSAWRKKAHERASRAAGFFYPAYGHLKLAGIVEDVVSTVRRVYGGGRLIFYQNARSAIWEELKARGLEEVGGKAGMGAAKPAIEFFRVHDLGFRIRRLRFIARSLAEDVEASGAAPAAAIESLHDTIYRCLAVYLERETADFLGDDFAAAAEQADSKPGALLDRLAVARDLVAADRQTDRELAKAFALLPKEERRSMLLAYLGFPFYDIATLPLLEGEGLDEFDPIKVDRISPDDANAIREGGARETLKGIEFNTFGAFFSRSYRENDYLWGRLHGADRLVDILLSALPESHCPNEAERLAFKKRAFHSILDEEEGRLDSVSELIESLRKDIGGREAD